MPILGYVDEFVIVPAGLALAIKLIPEEVMCECRSRAEGKMNQKGPKNYVAAALIAAIWLGLILLSTRLLYNTFYK